MSCSTSPKVVIAYAVLVLCVGEEKQLDTMFKELADAGVQVSFRFVYLICLIDIIRLLLAEAVLASWPCISPIDMA
jgi:hypothetical protein